ncbi:hypothetical protein IEQ34_018732 [Dendrobium chrysotoxum]|uniref:Ribonuclease H1 N-terminal domain-containing protein n=1 Tax=Dendrobium chrysotoxum TaxID=161865 RepID=A0AAV7G6M4_DENCH|nr:hypothetical protein IEQ34_018732 [Dendrobium chrysotoxum]
MKKNIILEVSILSGNPVMICILYRSSAALFSRNSHVLMRSSLYRLPKAAWKRDIRHVCIGVIRSDCFILGFGIRCFSPQESQTSGIAKENLKPPMDDESDAFYVVRKGDIIGVYKSLSDCQAQVCDPSVSVYKGYALHKDSEDYLASRGFKDALYSMHAAYLKEDIFGTLVPCPFQVGESAYGTPRESKSTYVYSQISTSLGIVLTQAPFALNQAKKFFTLTR